MRCWPRLPAGSRGLVGRRREGLAWGGRRHRMRRCRWGCWGRSYAASPPARGFTVCLVCEGGVGRRGGRRCWLVVRRRSGCRAAGSRGRRLPACPPAADWTPRVCCGFAGGMEMYGLRPRAGAPRRVVVVRAVVSASGGCQGGRAVRALPCRTPAPPLPCAVRVVPRTRSGPRGRAVACAAVARPGWPPEDVVLFGRADERSDRIGRTERMVAHPGQPHERTAAHPSQPHERMVAYAGLRRLRGWGARPPAVSGPPPLLPRRL